MRIRTIGFKTSRSGKLNGLPRNRKSGGGKRLVTVKESGDFWKPETGGKFRNGIRPRETFA